MANEMSKERFERTVTAAIQSEVAAVAEEEIAEAQKRVAERVRERIGAIAISLCSNVNIARMSHEIVVTIRDENNPGRSD